MGSAAGEAMPCGASGAPVPALIATGPRRSAPSPRDERGALVPGPNLTSEERHEETTSTQISGCERDAWGPPAGAVVLLLLLSILSSQYYRGIGMNNNSYRGSRGSHGGLGGRSEIATLNRPFCGVGALLLAL